MNTTDGLCECGCGEKTTTLYGKHRRFISGHNSRGNLHNFWNGGIYKKDGYVFIKYESHPNRNTNNYVPEQVLIAEKALGKFLPDGAIVHHADGTRNNNKNNNLVVCQDAAYHFLLHARTRALNECGHAGWRKCTVCKKYDDPAIMGHGKKGGNYQDRCYHRDCMNEYNRNKVSYKNARRMALLQQQEASLAQKPEAPGPYVRMVRPKTGRAE
jgi:hypothetical protein